MADTLLRYKDKVTIVTGGSKGIGRGCAEVFVRHGSHVVFCALGAEEGETAAAEMTKKGPGTALFVDCDVRNEEDIKNLINTAVEKFGRIDCVINNAGTHPFAVKMDDVSADDFRDLLNYNVISYFLVAKYALPHLRKSQGNLIQVSSAIVQTGEAGSCTYTSSKGAILAMTQALAIDEAVHGVRVNSLIPGNIWTPLWESCAQGMPDPEAEIKAGEDCQLLGRFGTLEECGKACLFLAADGTFCTGTGLLVAGGAELNYGVKNPRAEGAYVLHIITDSLLRYKDKVTIVTGGSKGIGRGCAEVFVRHGSHVVFCALGADDGEAAAVEMTKKGPGTALFVDCDVRNEEDIKGAILAMTKALAIDEAIHGVRVNSLIPGNIWTPMWETYAQGMPDPQAEIKAGEDGQLLGRFGTPEECGKACLFLAADATLCTGTGLVASGGAELNYGVKNPKAEGAYVLQ